MSWRREGVLWSPSAACLPALFARRQAAGRAGPRHVGDGTLSPAVNSAIARYQWIGR